MNWSWLKSLFIKENKKKLIEFNREDSRTVINITRVESEKLPSLEEWMDTEKKKLIKSIRNLKKS